MSFTFTWIIKDVNTDPSDITQLSEAPKACKRNGCAVRVVLIRVVGSAWLPKGKQDSPLCVFRGNPPSSGGSALCFPDICSTFPFCVAKQKEVEWKNCSPPPTVATWQGRRAVGQEPAGRSRAYLWSAFSSASVWASLCARCRLSHTHNLKTGHRNRQEKAWLSPHSLCPLFSTLSLPCRLFILVGVTHEKASPPFFVAEMDRKDLATSAERYTTGQNEWLPSIGSHSLSLFLSCKHTL